MASVNLRSLTCHQTEDSTGADEIYLNLNGQRIFGPISINDGQTVDLVGVAEPFFGKARMELFDEDSPDADDPLGSITISEDDASNSLRSHDFTGDGARYTLSYQVF